MPPAVVLIATLDTKADEAAFVRQQLVAAGLDVVLLDAGVLGEPGLAPDVSRTELASAAGHDVAALAAGGDRGAAVLAMAEGAAAVVRRLVREGAVAGGLGLGGTGGTSIASRALRELPLGVPKVVVSTAASGDTAAYIGESDLILVPSVVDIAGLNRISIPILANAAAALAGMVTRTPVRANADRAMVAASMFGVTTPCVTRARQTLQSHGFEVLVFHMTGAGGRTMESLVRQGLLAGVLDLTTTELADELVGGVFSAGPGRLTAATQCGVPQVVSVGALDMVNFGPRDTVPARFADRTLHVHNASVTLMRTTVEESAELGRRVAARLAGASAPTTVLLPRGGVSLLDVPGEPFHDPDADRALFTAIDDGLRGTAVVVEYSDFDINASQFADRAVDVLLASVPV